MARGPAFKLGARATAQVGPAAPGLCPRRLEAALFGVAPADQRAKLIASHRLQIPHFLLRHERRIVTAPTPPWSNREIVCQLGDGAVSGFQWQLDPEHTNAGLVVELKLGVATRA